MYCCKGVSKLKQNQRFKYRGIAEVAVFLVKRHFLTVSRKLQQPATGWNAPTSLISLGLDMFWIMQVRNSTKHVTKV